jgi:ABC-2 type transport system permease protein
MGATSRLSALLVKELYDVSRNRAALLPVALVSAMALVLPLAIVIGIPAVTDSPLSDDADLARLSVSAGLQSRLSSEGRVQWFLFQQFLILFLLTPATGAMALAAHAVVGEKQARTLEPLLATPLTTGELLVAKVLGAFLPTLAITLLGIAAYFGVIGMFGATGVLRAMITGRTFLLIALVCPATALVSLQLALLISSRVNDARTAQQFAVLVILPVTGIVIAQFTGRLWLSAASIALIGAGLIAVWLLLLPLSVVTFNRETILTRWK